MGVETYMNSKNLINFVMYDNPIQNLSAFPFGTKILFKFISSHTTATTLVDGQWF